MPTVKNKLQRICSIYSIIRTAEHPPKNTDELIEKLNKKLSIKVCKSSIEKDLYDLKKDFGIQIHFNRIPTNRGYYITNANESTDKEFVANLLIYLSLQDIPIISDVLENLLE